jgi:hypothetical protein
MSAYVQSSIDARGDLCALSAKTLTPIEAIDSKVNELSRDLDKAAETLRSKKSVSKKKRKELTAIRTAAELLSERKALVAVRDYDLINQHICMIDQEIRVLERAMRINGDEKVLSVLGPVLQRSNANAGRRRGRNEIEEVPVVAAAQNFVIDPNEPVYCLCRQIAYGEMIACDNEDCPVEWFHYACVNLSKKPRSFWLCPECSRKRKQIRL